MMKGMGVEGSLSNELPIMKKHQHQSQPGRGWSHSETTGNEPKDAEPSFGTHPFGTARWLIRALISILLVSSSTYGAEDVRNWTSSAGTTLEAGIVSVDGDSVTLQRTEDGKHLKVKIALLSADDQAFLREYAKKANAIPLGKTTVDGIDAKPGVISGPITCGDGKWSYHLYLPKDFHTGKKWPVWFVMSPAGGKEGRPIQRYLDGADRLGCIVALSVESKNNNFGNSDLAMAAMADHVFGKLPVYDELGFSSGMSGGSRMAYLMAERDKRIAGVLACGSGSGVYLTAKDFRDAELRKSTYIYSLIGTNCFNRSEAVTSHEKMPKDYRLRFFPGGHAWADSTLIAQGMARVLGEALKNNKDNELAAERLSYADKMSAWMDEMAGDEPWEAAYWAEFLSTFPGNPAVATHAKSVASKLGADARVAQAADAEEDIRQFTRKHFNKYIELKAGKVPDASREAEAAKLAAKYPGLPHAEILTKLGGTS
jgi:hypothetical protein